MPGTLTIVATPIGNLGDITRRALDALAAADTVCAEDTRVTGRLLAAYAIDARLERCDENVIARRSATLVERMLAGENIAFCSDAGMPGVSDPGLVLVDACLEAGVPVEVCPGASAVCCAVAAAGFNGTAFYFGGFLPRKDAQRIKLLESLKALDATLVFYESPHRVAASCAAIAQVFPARRVALCRELTKLHEEVLRLPALALAENLAVRESIKGEIALVVEPPVAGEPASALSDEALTERIRSELAAGKPKSALAKELARELGRPKSELYELMLSLNS